MTSIYSIFTIEKLNFIFFTLATNTSLIETTENLLDQFVIFLKVIIEAIAIVIIAFAVFKALAEMWQLRKNRKLFTPEGKIRLELGISLVLALEFLLAADIIGTAISPSWSDIGKLGAIAGIRTFLNFFLEKELKQLKHKNHSDLIRKKDD